jgi:hypothetical protein
VVRYGSSHSSNRENIHDGSGGGWVRRFKFHDCWSFGYDLKLARSIFASLCKLCNARITKLKKKKKRWFQSTMWYSFRNKGMLFLSRLRIYLNFQSPPNHLIASLLLSELQLIFFQVHKGLELRFTIYNMGCN